MAWPTILANGRGLFGTSEFLFSVAHRVPALASPFHLERPRPIGPDFDRSPAEISSIRRGFDDSKNFSELNVHFTGGGRIGTRSFYPHNNVVRLLADSLGKRSDHDLVSTPLTVFHLDTWDFGFSPQPDIGLDADKSMTLASGSMYVGLPSFFRDLAIKGGIIEGAEGMWRFAGVDFPFDRHEGEISAMDAGDDSRVQVHARAPGVEGSLALSSALARLLRGMFGVERDEELIGQGAVLFMRGGDGLLALRPA